MTRRVYISCAPAFGEQELEEVKALHDFLEAAGCILAYSFPVGPFVVEDADVFVAVVAKGYKFSSHLHVELHLANNLKRCMGRPRLFGLRIGEWELPSNVEPEWLSDNNWDLLLKDLPERT